MNSVDTCSIILGGVCLHLVLECSFKSKLSKGLDNKMIDLISCLVV